ncbi:Lysophosphatidic Acid Receptor 1 [Manis pentadactyla]|nr:Lysophosphatidic Acid Receptor 1 [Manis pentadactyla]
MSTGFLLQFRHQQLPAGLSTWRGGGGPHLETPPKLALGLGITRVTFIQLSPFWFPQLLELSRTACIKGAPSSSFHETELD